VRTALHGDEKTADLQFKALPNYLGTDERIIVIADTSGSMSSIIGGSVEAIHVSMGMALYCSDKIGKKNPFYRKFIEFSCEGRFRDWSTESFSHAIHNHTGAVGSTRIDKALDLILKTAMKYDIKDEEMPTTLLIISDMQFHDGTADRPYWDKTPRKKGEVELALQRWTDNGYTIPKIVYWNTAAYSGSPAEADTDNIALVSGFSPSILKAIFEGTDFSPEAIMYRALEKYEEITVPDPDDDRKSSKKAKEFEKKVVDVVSKHVSKQNLFSNVLKSKQKEGEKTDGKQQGKATRKVWKRKR
jgi:hypothetical protein